MCHRGYDVPARERVEELAAEWEQWQEEQADEAEREADEHAPAPADD